jgi:hypothetical protein
MQQQKQQQTFPRQPTQAPTTAADDVGCRARRLQKRKRRRKRRTACEFFMQRDHIERTWSISLSVIVAPFSSAKNCSSAHSLRKSARQS